MQQGWIGRHLQQEPRTLVLASGFDPKTDVVEIKVADTGCGIPRENLPHVFEPFFTTKTEGKGLGLGLSTVFGIVDKHKGPLEVRSEAGQGATFTVRLPAGIKGKA